MCTHVHVPHGAFVVCLCMCIHTYRCGHCQAFTPEYKRLAKALKGFIKVGAVDANEHQSLGGRYGVRGFPTVKIFGSNKQNPSDYQGKVGKYFVGNSCRSCLHCVYCTCLFLKQQITCFEQEVAHSTIYISVVHKGLRF